MVHLQYSVSVFSELTEEEFERGYFQEEGAYSQPEMKLIRQVFGDRVISKRIWSPSSPDITALDFHLWVKPRSRDKRSSRRQVGGAS